MYTAMMVLLYGLALAAAWALLRGGAGEPVADPEFEAGEDEFVAIAPVEDERRDVA